MMGCFDELHIPWDQAVDLTDPAHLQENFREIDRWANPLVDNCSGASDPARAYAGYYSGTIAAAGTHIITGADLGGGGSSVALGGGMTYNATTGAFTPPREGMYMCSMQARIDGTGLANPYWLQLIAGGGADTRLIAPYATPLDYEASFMIRVFGIVTGLVFAIYNNITASHAIDFSLTTLEIVELPGADTFV